MACYDTSPYTCTYDSGGAGSLPGGGNPDYSSLITWEAASDNDLAGYSGPVVLDCYDSQSHNDTVDLLGATNTTPTIHRVIKSASGCAVQFSGRAGTGASFSPTGTVASTFWLREANFLTKNLCISLLTSYTASGYSAIPMVGGDNVNTGIVLNCVIHDCQSTSGSYYIHGVVLSYSSNCKKLVYNCIIYGCDGTGVILDQLPGDEFLVVACSTICANGQYGVSGEWTRCFAWSNYAADNVGGDFREYFSSSSGWNASKDNSASLNGMASNYKNSLDLTTSVLDADYLPLSTTNLSGASGAGANWGRNPYNDFTAVTDFSDFFKNDTGGNALSKADIRGTSRPSADTADSAWAVGAAEYVEPPAPTGGYRPVVNFLGL